MTKQIIINSPEIINQDSEKIIHQNAFILPNGNFILAKGYTGCNPYHQIESSALHISRALVNENIEKAYEEFLQNNNLFPRLYSLRSILVMFYGYALFARQETFWADKRYQFIDESLISDPQFYGKDVTPEQIETLKNLFAINDDGTLLNVAKDGSYSNDSTISLQRVLNRSNNRRWHKIF